MKTLVILRGIPGCGKSTYAKELNEWADREGYSCFICSTDDYWMRDGDYVFDASNLKAGHASCMISAERSMANGTNLVIVDNTNICKKDYAFYVEQAEKFGYKVEVTIIGSLDPVDVKRYKERNVHNVPDHVYARMVRDFEL